MMKTIKVLFAAILINLGSAQTLLANDGDGDAVHETTAEVIDKPWTLDFAYTQADSLKALEQIDQHFRNTKPNLLERAEALNNFYQKLMREERPVSILQIGDSHVAGREFPNAVKAVLQQRWDGSDNNTVKAQIHYDYLAKNGATMIKFLTPERLSAIAEKKPDLVIISFGTNECHGMGYDEATHYKQLEIAFDSLIAVCPDSDFLFTGPQGAYLKYRPNPMTVRCASLLKKFAADRNAAFWNIYEIAGGQRALQNYMAQGLLRHDRVHFTPQGYQLQGELLGKAIVNAFPNI